jgi:hypothetical protein
MLSSAPRSVADEVVEHDVERVVRVGRLAVPVLRHVLPEREWPDTKSTRAMR